MKLDDLVNGRTGVATAAMLAAIVLGFTSAQTPTMAAYNGMSEIAKLAAAGGIDALQQDLDARSPGLRAPGALTQTKGRPIASLKDAFKPKERVLSGERTRPGASEDNPPAIAYETGNVAGAGPDTTPGAVLADPGAGDGVVANLDPAPAAVGSYPGYGGGTTPIIISNGGGGGGSVGGGVSGGGGTGGNGGDGGTPPGVGGAVPEPATWLSLMLGFFAIGYGLRRTAPRAAQRAA